MGTALGLAIVMGEVEAHHGTIDVESIPDKGTTFRVLLPVTM
ncbi:MAG: ATP-binding protein [Desulfatiglandaceae bacterium]